MHTKGAAIFEKCVQQIDEKTKVENGKRSWKGRTTRGDRTRRVNKIFPKKKKDGGKENTKTMKWNDKRWHETAWCNGWPAADVRVIVTTEHTTIPWKITKKEVKQDEKKVFRKRWTSSFCVKQKRTKSFLFKKFQQTKELVATCWERRVNMKRVNWREWERERENTWRWW